MCWQYPTLQLERTSKHHTCLGRRFRNHWRNSFLRCCVGIDTLLRLPQKADSWNNRLSTSVYISSSLRSNNFNNTGCKFNNVSTTICSTPQSAISLTDVPLLFSLCLLLCVHKCQFKKKSTSYFNCKLWNEIPLQCIQRFLFIFSIYKLVIYSILSN